MKTETAAVPQCSDLVVPYALRVRNPDNGNCWADMPYSRALDIADTARLLDFCAIRRSSGRYYDIELRNASVADPDAVRGLVATLRLDAFCAGESYWNSQSHATRTVKDCLDAAIGRYEKAFGGDAWVPQTIGTAPGDVDAE